MSATTEAPKENDLKEKREPSPKLLAYRAKMSADAKARNVARGLQIRAKKAEEAAKASARPSSAESKPEEPTKIVTKPLPKAAKAPAESEPKETPPARKRTFLGLLAGR